MITKLITKAVVSCNAQCQAGIVLFFFVTVLFVPPARGECCQEQDMENAVTILFGMVHSNWLFSWGNSLPLATSGYVGLR
jgi:hypothetical protein